MKTRLRPDLVPVPAEDDRPEWPEQESDGKDGDGIQERRDRMVLSEEMRRQNRRQAPENVEVVPLDCRPDRRGADHEGQIAPIVIERTHRALSLPEHSTLSPPCRRLTLSRVHHSIPTSHSGCTHQ